MQATNVGNPGVHNMKHVEVHSVSPTWNTQSRALKTLDLIHWLRNSSTATRRPASAYYLGCRSCLVVSYASRPTNMEAHRLAKASFTVGPAGALRPRLPPPPHHPTAWLMWRGVVACRSNLASPAQGHKT